MAYRILSLDGGGSWALLQAMALGDIYGLDIKGRDILKTFDLAVSNSGGSIVLAALMGDLTPREIQNLFLDKAQRDSIFVRRFSLGDLIPFIPHPKYRTTGKLQGLTALLPGGTSTMAAWNALLPAGPGGATVKVVMTAFNYDTERVEFFRTYTAASGAAATPATLADAVHASTNAPVLYFDKPTDWNGGRFWDGAIAGYNNPILAGIVEAMSAGAARTSDIQVRSIGTGAVRLAPPTAVAAPELKRVRKDAGLFADLRKLAGSITDDPPDAASYTAFIALGNLSPPVGQTADGGSVVRLNPIVQPVWENNAWDFPLAYRGGAAEHKAFADIAALDMDATRDEDVTAIKTLGDAWMADQVPNQAIRPSSATYDCVIGDATYSAGKARWL